MCTCQVVDDYQSFQHFPGRNMCFLEENDDADSTMTQPIESANIDEVEDERSGEIDEPQISVSLMDIETRYFSTDSIFERMSWSNQHQLPESIEYYVSDPQEASGEGYKLIKQFIQGVDFFVSQENGETDKFYLVEGMTEKQIYSNDSDRLLLNNPNKPFDECIESSIVEQLQNLVVEEMTEEKEKSGIH